MSTTTAVPIIRADDEGEKRWWYGGGVHTWKVTAAETNGAFCMFEDLMVRGKMTPLHSHPEVDEMLYVLEGEILVQVNNEQRSVASGGAVMAPRGVAHAFCVTSDTARILCMVTPGSAEAFYRQASQPAGDNIDGSGPVDFARVQEAAKQTGATEILGPPPFEAP